MHSKKVWTSFIVETTLLRFTPHALGKGQYYLSKDTGRPWDLLPRQLFNIKRQALECYSWSALGPVRGCSCQQNGSFHLQNTCAQLEEGLWTTEWATPCAVLGAGCDASNKALHESHELHACFIDLSKVVDFVDRPLVWKILSCLGFPRKMLQLIKDLHDNTTCAMQADKNIHGSWFQVSSGFKQGDVNATWASNWPRILTAIQLAAENQMVVCPAGFYCMQMIWSSLRRTASKFQQFWRLRTKPCKIGVCRWAYPRPSTC